MTIRNDRTGLQMRSLAKASGELEISLARVPIGEPASDEILVRIEAAPINPSDLGLLIGPGDVSSARVTGNGDEAAVSLQVPRQFRAALTPRTDKSLPVGNEGAGVVVEAGASPEAQALIGRTVAILGGAMYAEYRTVKAADVLVVHADATPRDAASCFVNPLTALGMVGSMRMEGHTALVHTAAASNLGQMLVRICQQDNVELVNIVRSPAQVALLKAMGARYVLDATAPSFMEDLIGALSATGATLAFDAVGGGELASQILTAMEAAALRSAPEVTIYGSTTHKQVYIYGVLDNRPTELNRAFGMAWGVGGWLLPFFLQKIEPAEAARLRQRVADELKTTFASRYTAEISLTEALQPALMAAYNRKTTGEKYLINPQKGR